MNPPITDQLGVRWTLDEALSMLGPRAEPAILAYLVSELLTADDDGRYDAGDLMGLHRAIRPWLDRRQQPAAV